MEDGVWQRLDHGARCAVPAAVAIIFTLLSVVAWPLPHFGTVTPPLGLIAVYYWAIHRPDLFRPFMACLIGLLHDFLNGLPLGLSALLFVAAYQLVLQQRRYFAGHSFFMLWGGFFFTAVLTGLATWLLLDVWRWSVLPLAPVLMQIAFTVVLFPLPCALLIIMQRMVLSFI